jgi:Cu(I)/Ag(I) efflux system membrane fusion protein
MTEKNVNEPSRPTRRFGAGAIVLAIVASGIAAAGGTWFLSHRGHDEEAHAGEGPAPAPAKERWQCPMHPTIVQDHPGDCPICGMKLVKVEGSAGAGGAGAAAAAEAPPEKDQWQCPMHPSIVEDQPGDCPICGMKLVKIERSTKVALDAPGPEGLAAVTIDVARQQLIGLKVAHVERAPVGGSWRTSGRIAVDETRVHHVNVKVSGFMEKVYADFIGRPVRRGEPLFAIYSPDLLAAQQEYLLALDTRRRLGKEGALAADGDALVAAARRKLELWDVPRSEIERLEKGGEASRTITFSSPASGVVTKKDVVPGMRVNAGDMPFEIVDLSRVWLLADAYETDLRHVRVGQEATLALKAFPGHTFQGRVAFVDPMLDPRTRTAKVRIEFPNPRGELKPEMFGEVVLQGAPRKGLRIPADAVIHSGTQSVVFVALGEGKFQPRQIEVGEGDADWVEVVSGLEEGDGVVTRANFLVDSESRLRASLAALPSVSLATPASGGQAGHAGHAAEEPAPPPPPAKDAGADPHAGHRR